METSSTSETVDFNLQMPFSSYDENYNEKKPFSFSSGIALTSSLSNQQSIPRWLQEFLERVLVFLKIQQNEGSVKGVYLKKAAIFDALNLLVNAMADTTCYPYITLDDSGSLCLEWEKGEAFFSISVNGSNTYEIYVEGVEEAPLEKELDDYKQVAKILESFTCLDLFR